MIPGKNLLSFFVLPLISLLFVVKAYPQDEPDMFSMELEDLVNIKVTTASKFGERLSDAPGVLSVVTRNELERFGGTTLKDILERVPGLISSGSNYTNRVTIAARGEQIKLNSSHVLILLNGRPVREVQEGGNSSEILEAFPVSAIERIEVIKGPGSVLYGSDAFCAVINIITFEAEKTGLSVTALEDNGNGYNASISASYLKNDFSITAAFRAADRPLWETDYRAFGAKHVTDTSTSTELRTVRVNIPDKGIGSFLQFRYKGFSLSNSYSQWKTSYFQSGFHGIVENKKLFSNAGYSMSFSDLWKSDFNLTVTNSVLDGQLMSKRNSYNLVAEWTNFFLMSESSNLVIGGLFNRNEGREEMSADFSPTVRKGIAVSEGYINSFALYSQFDIRPAEKIKMIAGLQAIKPDKIPLNVVPRIGIILEPLPWLFLKALYSQAFRAPGINEVKMKMAPVLRGNPELTPEKVSTFDFSIGYQGVQSQAAINLFYSKMTDLIKVVRPSPNDGQYQNATGIVFSGIEFEAKHYLSARFFICGSAVYTQNKDDKGTRDLAPISDFGAKAGISYMSYNGLTFSLFNIYQGPINSKYSRSINSYQGAYNLLHFKGILNLNKYFNVKFYPDLTVLLNVDNLLDRVHYGYDFGGISGDAIPSIPGRAVYVGLQADL